MAIIAILAATLFPVFAKARQKACNTACIHNLKSLALALVMYSLDYDGCGPGVGHPWGGPPYSGATTPYTLWPVNMDSYVKARGIFKDPCYNGDIIKDEDGDGKFTEANGIWAPADWNNVQLSYGCNIVAVSLSTVGGADPNNSISSWFNPAPTDQADGYGGGNFSRLADPSHVIAFCDAPSPVEACTYKCEFDAKCGWEFPIGCADEGEVVNGVPAVQRLRHGDSGSNWAFCDGHAKNMARAAIGPYQCAPGTSGDGDFTIPAAEMSVNSLQWWHGLDQL